METNHHSARRRGFPNVRKYGFETRPRSESTVELSLPPPAMKDTCPMDNPIVEWRFSSTRRRTLTIAVSGAER